MSRFPLLLCVCAMAAAAAEWSAPVEVQHDEHRVVAYRAKIAGDLLAVEVKLEPGWHTFAIDNQKRAEERLAGKKSLGIDQPTEIQARQGLEIAGPWRQTPPKDFSRPELRWFSFGFDREALFVAKVRPAGGTMKIGIRGQACTDALCKNVDVELVVSGSVAAASKSDIDLKGLVAVK